MVSNVKNSGMTLVELVIAMVILSIGVLGLVSVTITTNKLNKRSNTNDVAYAIARDRLAVLQNGDMPLRWIDSGKVIRDNIIYTVVDTISEDTTNNTRVAHIYVNWNIPTPREVKLSGYMIREMCPDQSSSAPTDIRFDVDEIVRNTPAAFTLGRVSIDDPDSGDQHLLVLDSSLADNNLFRLVHMDLQTAVTHSTPGDYTIVLQAIDCDGNEIERSFVLTVPDADPAPYFIATSDISIDENSARGSVIGTLKAFPDTVSFQLISQTHPVAVAIDPVTGVITVEDDTLYNHEQLSDFSVVASVSNGAGVDSIEFTVEIANVNEVPTEMHISGALAFVGEGAYIPIGVLSTVDPDADDHDFSYYMTDPTAGYFRLINDTVTTSEITLVEGFYDIYFETVDQGGLSYYDTVNIEIRDTTASDVGMCGSYEEWSSTKVYNAAGIKVFHGNNVYSSKHWTYQNTPAVNSDQWEYVEACDGKPQCADFPYYSRYSSYQNNYYVYWKKDASESLVNTIFKAKQWVGTNRKPHKKPSYWDEVYRCY